MTRNPPPLENGDGNGEFADALRNLELARITGKPDTHESADGPAQLWGLALSGGGIRSATFGLGVLQGLAERGLLGAFHYCSTVSGGGYIGGYLQAMLRRRGWDRTIRCLVNTRVINREKATSRVPHHGTPSSGFTDSVLDLRRYSNFLTPNKRFLSGDRIAMVATYLSNMLLTWLQLGALILLVSFVPMLAMRGLAEVSRMPLLLWGAATVLAVLALSSRPRLDHGPRGDEQEKRRAAKPGASAKGARKAPPDLMRTAIPALLATVFVLLTALVWVAPACEQSTCGHGYELFANMLAAGFGIDLALDDTYLKGTISGISVSATYLIGFLAWLVWWWPTARSRYAPTFGRRVVRQLIWGVLAALSLGWAVKAYAPLIQFRDPFVSIALGTPLLFAAFFVVNLLHQSLAYLKGDAVSRERWTRLMGRTAIWILAAVSIPLIVTVLAPAEIIPLLPAGQEEQVQIGKKAWGTALAIWSALSGAGVLAAYRDDSMIPRNLRGRLLRVLIGLAFWVFLTGIAVALGYLAFCIAIGPGQSGDLTNWVFDGDMGTTFIVVGCTLAAWCVLARYIDENEFSMNGFYRNRLVRCYLAPSRKKARRDWETGQDPDGDDIVLEDLVPPGKGPRPLYPLVCCAVNIVKTERLDWQDRKSASFVFSPLYCGHQPLPGGQTGAIGDPLKSPALLSPKTGLSPSPLAANHTLGAAMSVSGAAVSPNMGYHSSPGATALLTLFNARLGWWVENHNAPDSAIYFAGLNLLSELLGNTRANSRHVYVSDGGHFENTGIYELVRRKCRFILAVDATADPRRQFSDLANAVRKCRIDFGAEIDIDTSLLALDEKGLSRRCAALGKIVYADGKQGVLLYVKPSLMGTESADVAGYARSHSAFPHEPTHDQFFDEAQFECYRQLGYETTLNVFDEKVRGVGSLDRPVGLQNYKEKEDLVQSLTYRLYEPSSATAAFHTRYGDELTVMFERLRCSEGLRFLDRQLYPGFRCKSVVGQPIGPGKNFPDEKDFRECFYFIQQLIQLMEGVYMDLDLERNWDHPDNRGWMNKFRHWSWMPLFRLVWSLTLQTMGTRFVRFCETHLGIPRIDDACTQIHWQSVDDEAGLRALVSRLHHEGRINLVEKGILLSNEVIKHANEGPIKLGLLDFVRNQFLKNVYAETSRLDPMGVGIAVVVDEAHGGKLVVHRIQDHLRRLGFGLIFMRKVVRQFPALVRVDMGEGDFGKTIDSRLVAAQREELATLLVRARIAEAPFVECEKAKAAGPAQAAT